MRTLRPSLLRTMNTVAGARGVTQLGWNGMALCVRP